MSRASAQARNRRRDASRSRSRSRDSSTSSDADEGVSGRFRFLNPRQHRAALAGLSRREIECMVMCLSAELTWVTENQVGVDIFSKVNDFKDFLKDAMVPNGWAHPSNGVEAMTRFFALMDEVSQIHMNRGHNHMLTTYQRMAIRASMNGPGLFNGRREPLGDSEPHRFTGTAHRLA